MPQLANCEVSQVLPLQHPVGHDAELHTHAPPTHACPAPHAGPEPQLHCPELEQLSAVEASHCTQATPAVPQLPNAEVSQLAPEQHPPAQLVEVQPVQTPPTQFWSAGHIEQLAPPVPHIAVVLPVSQTLPLQQPVGQEVALHTHCPRTHTWPEPQAAPLPHVHVPVGEHVSAFAPHFWQAAPFVPHAAVDADSHTVPLQQPVGHDVASQTHLPPTHAWPAAHAGPPPQVQLPAVHASDAVALHCTHAAPAVPQLLCDGIVHCVP